METGDFQALDLEELEKLPEPTAVALPPTKILPSDPQRAVPTAIYEPERLEASSSEETQVPASATLDEETVSLAKPGPPVAERSLEPAYLVVEKGPGAGRSVAVVGGELTIGRSSGNGLSLALPSVSRHHATLVRNGERFFLRDEGSHNGTFVSGEKISGQVEIRSGDSIAMGKALLVLRASGSDSGVYTTTTAVGQDRPWLKLTIFAAAVGLGILTVFAVASRGSRVAEQPPEVASAPVAAETPPLPPSRPIEPAKPDLEMRPIQPPPQASDISLVGDSEPEVRPASNPPSSGTRESAQPERREEEHRASRTQTTRREREGKRPAADSSGARSLYESGDLDAALAAAQKAGATELASKIAAFKKEFAAARADLSFKDGAGAIKHFTAALAIDEEISNGWSKHGGEIRANLSKLYQMAGMREIEKGDNAKAQALLERALKYDPSNEKAKTFLEKVKGSQNARPADAASAADQAFGD